MGAVQKTKSVMTLIKDKMTTEAVLWDNEIRANMMLARIMLISVLILLSTLMLNEFGIYDLNKKVLYPLVLQGTLELLTGMRADIDVFAGEAEQFDDITMIGFRLNAFMSEKQE